VRSLEKLLNSPKQIASIQVLRAAAAAAVAIAHTHFEANKIAELSGTTNPLPTMVLGAAGVDLFFVISGFIMVYSSWQMFGYPRSPWVFAVRRIVRIVPLYWLGTTVMLFYTIRLQSWDLSKLDWSYVAASYFFIPHLSPQGEWMPLLGLGWTLNHEMFFYLAFAVVLPFRPAIAVTTLVAFLLAFSLSGSNVPLPQALRYLANQHLWEFALGALIGLAYCAKFRLQKWVALSVGFGGLAVIVACGIWDIVPDVASRFVAWGIPSGLMMVAALHLAESDIPARRWLILAGDASYCIYILHVIIMPIIRNAALAISPGLVFGLWTWPWIYVAVLASLTILLAVVFHVFVERHATDYLRKSLPRSWLR
jgi:exopolysaccharide production protein ExoZ